MSIATKLTKFHILLSPTGVAKWRGKLIGVEAIDYDSFTQELTISFAGGENFKCSSTVTFAYLLLKRLESGKIVALDKIKDK